MKICVSRFFCFFFCYIFQVGMNIWLIVERSLCTDFEERDLISVSWSPSLTPRPNFLGKIKRTGKYTGRMLKEYWWRILGGYYWPREGTWTHQVQPNFKLLQLALVKKRVNIFTKKIFNQLNNWLKKMEHTLSLSLSGFFLEILYLFWWNSENNSSYWKFWKCLVQPSTQDEIMISLFS